TPRARRTARRALARLRARRAALGRFDLRTRATRERRLRAVALARPGGSAALVPLARPARERNRLGRAAPRVRAGRAAGRRGRAGAERSRAATSRRLPAELRSRRRVPVLVP